MPVPLLLALFKLTYSGLFCCSCLFALSPPSQHHHLLTQLSLNPGWVQLALRKWLLPGNLYCQRQRPEAPSQTSPVHSGEKPTFGVNPRGPPVKVLPAPHAPPCPPGNRIHNGAGPARHKDDSCAAGLQPEGPPPEPRSLLNLFIDALALSVA